MLTHRAIPIWLLVTYLCVFAMVVIGAITRLTESGLSMVEWRPLIGALPPMSETEWERVFHLYQQSPEFQKVNFWMELDDFKRIFFWEWLHRLWGRMLGVIFALPLAFFWIRNLIPKGYHKRLLILLFLGAVQGAMGWIMVRSGLVDRPSVSHYRLAAHLGFAFLIAGVLLWFALDLMDIKKRAQRELFLHTVTVLLFVSVTVLWGAFVAGLDAGLLYGDSFPKMGGQWIPQEMWQLDPAWINMFENRAVVQFVHRWLGIGSVLMVAGLWGHALVRKSSLRMFHALMGMVILQMVLGILTLYTGVSLHVAASHQAGAFIIISLLAILTYQTKGLTSSKDGVINASSE